MVGLRTAQSARAMAALLLCLTASAAISLGLAVAVRAQQSQSDAQVTAEQVSALMDEGQTIFGSECAACHGAEGSEGAAPALAGNVSLGSKDHVIRQILEGTPAKGMPPFGLSLTDRKVAAVGTFIRNAWENANGAVPEDDVKRLREELSKKK